MKLFISFLFLINVFVFPQVSVLDSLLNQIKNKHNLVGMTVSVSKNGEVAFTKGYGLRDVGRNLIMNDSSAYRIASISKTVTSIALMILYEDGLFSFEDDISNYIGFQLRNPNFPTQIIKIKQILSHTSSLRDGTGYDGFLSATYSQNPPPPISSLLISGGNYYTANMFSSSAGPNSDYFSYSNINFGIIGSLIEKLSGKRFDIFCKDNIFDPLGINASYNIDHFNDVNNIAVLYRRSGNSWSPQLDNYGGIKPPPRNLSAYTIGSNGAVFGPQGGLRISGTDLTKIMLILSNGGIYEGIRILNDSTVDKILTPVWIYNGSNGNNYYGIFNAYGFGCSRTTELLSGEILYGHPGEAYGLISDMYFSKVKNYGIMFITNGGQWGNGVYSGWYNVEEQIFTSVLQQINNILQSTRETTGNISDYFLEQNYPNPFNPVTSISYQVPGPSNVTLRVFDILGNEVFTLVNEIQIAGSYTVNFNAAQLSSGIYIYQLVAGSFIQTKKMILLK